MTPTVGTAWALLVVAGLLEIVWALGLKYSDGFTKPLPSVVVIVGAAASFWLLSIAMRVLPAGTAYAVWVGIGAVGTFLVSVTWRQETTNPANLLAMAALVLSIVAVKVTAPH